MPQNCDLVRIFAIFVNHLTISNKTPNQTRMANKNKYSGNQWGATTLPQLLGATIMVVTTYKTEKGAKAAAKRYAQKFNLDFSYAEIHKVKDSKAWFYNFHNDATLLADYGVTHCPHCGISLDNGVTQHDPSDPMYKHDHFEFACLGCGEEFGEAIASGIKIEKNRPTQNGITRPSYGGKCRKVWDICDAYLAKHGTGPSLSTIKTIADEYDDEEVKTSNAVIEMYYWRKFHGRTQ